MLQRAPAIDWTVALAAKCPATTECRDCSFPSTSKAEFVSRGQTRPKGPFAQAIDSGASTGCRRGPRSRYDHINREHYSRIRVLREQGRAHAPHGRPTA